MYHFGYSDYLGNGQSKVSSMGSFHLDVCCFFHNMEPDGENADHSLRYFMVGLRSTWLDVVVDLCKMHHAITLQLDITAGIHIIG